DLISECASSDQSQRDSWRAAIGACVHVHDVRELNPLLSSSILDEKEFSAICHLVYEIPHQLLHCDVANHDHQRVDNKKHWILRHSTPGDCKREEHSNASKPNCWKNPLVKSGVSGREFLS